MNARNVWNKNNYRETCGFRRTKSPKLNVSRFVLQLSLIAHPIKAMSVKSRMKIYLGQRRQAVLQLHLSDQLVHCLKRCGIYQRFDFAIDYDKYRLNSLA